MQFLKADTAATILIGPFLDKTDGVTPETGITLAAADAAELMKHDGTTFVDLTSDSRTFTHKQGGMYTLVLSTGDVDTEGRLTVFIADDDVCLPVWKDFMVVNANVYDSLFAAAATDYLQVDAKQLDGSAIQQAGGYAKVKDDEGNALANEAKQDIIDTVVDGIQTDLDNATDGLGALKALIDTLDTVADAIKAVTDNLPDSGALNDLAAILTDTGTTLPATLATIAGYIDTEVASILAAVDTEVAAIKAVTDLLPDAGALSDLATILADTNELQGDWVNGGRLDLLIDAIKAVTDSLSDLATLVDAVWDEDVDTSHQTAGTAGKKLDDAGAAADPWATALPGAYGAGTAGKIVGDNVNAPIATVDTVVDAIKAITDNLPDSGALNDLAAILVDTGTTLPATLATMAGYIDTEVATLLTRLSAARAGYLDNLSAGATALEATLTTMKHTAAGAFDRDTDSLEAIRDRGDAAWITGGGAGITDILNIISAVPESIDLADTVTVRLGLYLVNSIDDLPSTAEITPGTISIDRKAPAATSWTAVVTDIACSEAAGMVYYDEVFDSSAGYDYGDSIRITFKSQKIVVSANDYEISDATGRIFYSRIREDDKAVFEV